ncbi:MAG TPA: hypothetical protein VFF65_04505 [Phycisphaerales bacterium]|nr:hypothetical protein [Phycisphaerales bacterium]
MIRARHSWTNPRTQLAAACGLALVLSLLPWRASFWVQAPANLLSIFVSPLQNGFTKVMSPIAVKRGGDDGPGGGERGRDFELLRTRYLQIEQENRQLRAQVEALQRGVKVAEDLGTPRVVAGSLGLRGSLLQLRTDHIALQPDGVSPIGAGSVVVLEGVNIVGRVVSPGGKVSFAQLIADASGPEVRGVVRPREGGMEVLEAPGTEGGTGQPEYGVRLQPTEGGRLTGSVYLIARSGAGKRLEPVKPGARVRLADPNWPRFAQMLIIGEVESVSIAQNDRQMVTVRPMYETRELAGADFTVLIQPPLPPMPAAPAPPKGGR